MGEIKINSKKISEAFINNKRISEIWYNGVQLYVFTQS